MRLQKRKLFLHVCTTCGKERQTTDPRNPTGLCQLCATAHNNAHAKKHRLHFLPGAIYAEETLARFWSHVDKEAPCTCHSWEDRCWPWAMAYNKDGYGIFGIYHGHKMPAHRFAYQAEYGELPSNIYALHRPPCLVRSCVRHIYAGTPQENTKDIYEMGRGLLGERNHKTTLTTAEVLAIRVDHAKGMRLDAISQKYGKTRSNIEQIVYRRTWKHLS